MIDFTILRYNIGLDDFDGKISVLLYELRTDKNIFLSRRGLLTQDFRRRHHPCSTKLETVYQTPLKDFYRNFKFLQDQ